MAGNKEGALVESGTSRRRSAASAFLWFAVALPLLIYVGAIGLAEAKVRGAPKIEVAIEGYDPRDLFRGQYFQYRISVAEFGGVNSYRGRACAGSEKDGRRSVYMHDGVIEPEDCQIDLPADFVYEAHRFYVQQDRARKLEEAVRDGRASVTLRLVSPRQVVVEELLIDGKPIR